MSPEFGSTAAIFPIDAETIRYLRLTGRPEAQLELVGAYAKERGMWHDMRKEPRYSENIQLDHSTATQTIARPTRPQHRVSLTDTKQHWCRRVHQSVK